MVGGVPGFDEVSVPLRFPHDQTGTTDSDLPVPLQPPETPGHDTVPYDATRGRRGVVRDRVV
jgi:hypothetical protein